MKRLILLFLLFAATVSAGEHKFRVLGLFQPDREADLQVIVDQMDEIALVKVDFKNAEATFEFDAAKLFPEAKAPDKILEQFGQKLRGESQGTFELLPISEIPAEQLKEVRIPIVGLDCKGCSYAAYLAVYKIEGVERATASFHDGRVTAWIDSSKTDRAALEEALTKKQVTLAEPAAAAPEK